MSAQARTPRERRRLRLLSKACRLLAVAAARTANGAWDESQVEDMDGEALSITDEVHEAKAWDANVTGDHSDPGIVDMCPDHSQACQLAAQAATLAQEWEDNRLLCQGCWDEGHDHVIGTICQTCGH